MTIRHVFITAYEGLRTNKMRSGLTILGIVIGITSIILIQSIGTGAQNLILDQIRGLGSQTVVIRPGRMPKGVSDIASELYLDSLKSRDLQALQNKGNEPYVQNVIPLVLSSASGSYAGQAKTMTIIGASPAIAQVLNIYPAQGDFFTEDDVTSRAAVILIGAQVKEDLFGQADALGEKIKVKDRMYRVVGVFPKKGQIGFFNLDDAALMPYTAVQEYVSGTDYFHEIVLQATNEQQVSRVVEDTLVTMRASHGITDPDKDDFYIETQVDIMARVGVVTGILTLLLSSVAAISLVVGGVGIMNIMLVSVTERTKEIGLRKALGATDTDILGQFLAEAVLLTGTGGLVGIAAGGLLSLGTSFILTRALAQPWPFAFSLGAVLLGLLVSGGVGLAFGLYPARQAAQKQPIEALRYE